MEYYQLDIKEVFSKLKTTEKGLSDSQVKNRQQKYGYNELTAKKKTSAFKIFIRQFKSVLVLILIAAIIVSAAVGEFVDAILILAIVVFNAVLGLIQEYKAERSIEALKKLQSLKCIVIRDGKKKEILGKDLVPGDILYLEEGSKIPADARLFEAINMRVDEASLTGESTAVDKKLGKLSKAALAEQKDMVFSGTSIVRGKGKAIVTDTGMETEIGKIAELIQEAKEKETPLQKKLAVLGKWLGISILIITILVFIVGIIKQGEFTAAAITVVFLGAISLAVAAIPEGLPAVVTISLALGIKRMIKRNVLIRKLPTIETLGSTNIICSDKTGTLTLNKMTVTDLYYNDKLIKVTGKGHEKKGDFLLDNKKINPKELDLILKIGAYCNNAEVDEEVVGDPTEIALLISAKKANVMLSGTRIDEEPFESEKKYMSITYKINNKKIKFYKGASEVILKKCKYIIRNNKKVLLTKSEINKLVKINDVMAERALRVLAMAYDDGSGLVFVGMQGMIDPPRKEVKGAIEKCHDAGIRVIMITGDHILTAKAIAKEIGLKGEALSGVELDKMNERELAKVVKKVNIFARVNPEHKVKILMALKKQKNVVAMTGDGVNDAPALKNADIGVAMGKIGTDVSREASDMILTDDNFSSIVNAVEEGRGIYDNIKKFVAYLLSSNLGEVLFIVLVLIFIKDVPVPLLAAQLLWLNIVTDGFPALALGVDPAKKNIMKDKPRKIDDKILSTRMKFNILIVGIFIAVTVLYLFNRYLPDLDKARTVAFTALVVFELVRLYAIRAEYKLGIFSNKYLILAVGLSIFLQLVVIYTPALASIFKIVPLGLGEWYVIFIAAGVLLVLNFVVRLVTKGLFHEQV